MNPPTQTPRKLGGSVLSSLETPFRTPHRTPGGEQLSATPVVNFEAIEAQKENVKPLARGRSAHALNTTLSMQHKERREALLEQRRQYETKLASPDTTESDDPLETWTQYVKWTVDNYPSGQSAESGLVPLLERVTRAFKDSEQYRNDSRYLRLWILYARNVECPRDVYNFLLANELGTQLASLYEELAVVLEGSGILDEADSMYRLGIARSAQPLDRIKRHYQEFQQRIMLNPSDGSSSGEPLSYQSALKAAMGKAGRSLLGSTTGATAGKQSFSQNTLRGLGITSNAGIPVQKAASNDNRGKIAVFKDDDDDVPAAASTTPWSKLGTYDQRKQENTQRVDQMIGSRLPQSQLTSVRTPGRTLKVCRDSDDDEENHRTASTRKPTKTTILQQPQSETDLLRKNPFMHWGPDAKLKPDEADLAVPAQPIKKVRPKTVLGSSNVRSHGKGGDKDRAKAKDTKIKESSSSKKDASKSKLSTSRAPVPPTTKSSCSINCSLLYPGLVDGDDPFTHFQKGTHANEYTIEEVLARKRGLHSPDHHSDPWAHLDALEGQWLPVIEVQRAHTSTSPPKTSPVRSTKSTSPAQRDHYDPDDSIANAEALNMRLPVKPAAARAPSPTMITKATMLEVASMFNGDDDDSDESSSSSSSEEEEDYLPQLSSRSISRRPAVPETPTPMGRSLNGAQSSRALAPVHDENAGQRIVPRQAAQKPAIPVRGPLGMATPMKAALGIRKPLGLKPIEAAEEEEEEGEEDAEEAVLNDGLQARSSQVLARRVSPSDVENEDSDPDDDYLLVQHEDYVNVGLSPITERTEFTRFTTARTPGSSKGDFSAKAAAATPGTGAKGRSDYNRQFSEERSFESSASAVGYLENDTAHQGRPALELPQGLTIVQRDEEEEKESTSNMAQEQLQSSSKGVTSNPPNPCAPTDPRVIDHVLSALEHPLESSAGFFDLSHLSAAGRLDALQKRAKSMARRSVGSTSAASSAKDWQLEIDGVSFDVRMKLGEGGYGAVFLAEDVHDQIPRHWDGQGDVTSRVAALSINPDSSGMDEDRDEARRFIAIKVETPPNKWEFYILEQLRSRLAPRLLSSIVSARRFYSYADESFLLLEYGDKGTLLEVVNNASTANVAPTGGLGGGSGVDETLAMFFTIELLRLLEGLHGAQLLHGDVKIDNCLLRLGETKDISSVYSAVGENKWSTMGLTLIDFGRAVDLAHLPAGQQCCADWDPDLRDCPEMREGRPWTHQADYFGAAGVAHCLLFGKYIETVTDEQGQYRIAAPLRRYWQNDLWARLFDVLLNSTTVRPDRQLPITEEVAAVRKDMETWLELNCNKAGRNLKGLLRRLQIWKLN